MSENKFDKLFNEEMTSLEARTVLFSLADHCTKEELVLLKVAYEKVSSKILKRELAFSEQTGYMQ